MRGYAEGDTYLDMTLPVSLELKTKSADCWLAGLPHESADRLSH